MNPLKEPPTPKVANPMAATPIKKDLNYKKLVATTTFQRAIVASFNSK